MHLPVRVEYLRAIFHGFPVVLVCCLSIVTERIRANKLTTLIQFISVLKQRVFHDPEETIKSEVGLDMDDGRDLMKLCSELNITLAGTK